MLYPPWEATGQLQNEISQMRSELNRKAESYEISTLNSKVGSLEHTMREISTALDGIRAELQTLQEVINTLSARESG